MGVKAFVLSAMMPVTADPTNPHRIIIPMTIPLNVCNIISNTSMLVMEDVFTQYRKINVFPVEKVAVQEVIPCDLLTHEPDAPMNQHITLENYEHHHNQVDRGSGR